MEIEIENFEGIENTQGELAIKFYESEKKDYYTKGEILKSVSTKKNSNGNYVFSFVLNINNKTSFKKAMVYLKIFNNNSTQVFPYSTKVYENPTIVNTKIYRNKQGNLTNSIRQEYINANIISLPLIQFFAENTESQNDEDYNISFTDTLVGGSQVINLRERRHLNLYLEEVDEDQQQLKIPNITMGSAITAYVTGILVQEVI